MSNRGNGDRSIFVDRKAEKEQLRLLINEAAHHRRQLSLVEIEGGGGLGKSRLLAHLAEEARAQVGLKCVLVDLTGEADESTRALDAIHAQLDIGCPLYLYARNLLALAQGQNPRIDVEKPLHQFLRGTFGVATALSSSTPGPWSLMGSAATGPLYEALGTMIKKAELRGADAELKGEIDDCRNEPADLLRRLPRCLASDLRRANRFDRDRPDWGLAVAYDGFGARPSYTGQRPDGWFPEFLSALGFGLHVVATRTSIAGDLTVWQTRQTKLDNVRLRTIKVGPLGDDHVGELIDSTQPTLDERDRRLIVERAQGSPFLAASALAPLQRGVGRARWRRSIREQGSLIGMMLDHLDDSTQTLTVALAAIGVYDEALFNHLRKELGLPVAVPSAASTLLADAFCDRHHFVERVPDTVGPGTPTLYRIHDLLVQRASNESAHQAITSCALEAATRYLRARQADSAADRAELLYLVEALFARWSAQSAMSTEMVELMMDICYDFHDRGFWLELGAIEVEAEDGHPIVLIERFFEALRVRRTEQVVEAKELLDALADRISGLGYHGRSFELESAYFAEIAGDYHQARRTFEYLDRTASPFDPGRRDHVKARQNHCDMLFMDGRFDEANRRLSEAQHAPGFDDPHLKAELVRLRGHTYRFSLLPRLATELYLDALVLGQGAPAMEAKLMTNLAEAAAWYDAEVAIDYGRRSLAANEALRNVIEQSKASAALSLAHSAAGDAEEANRNAMVALKWAETATYPAGEAFAVQALVLAAARRHDLDQALDHYVDLRERVGALGVYAHLLVVPRARLAEAGVATDRLGPPPDRPQWIDGDTVDQRIDDLCRGS